MKTTLITGRQGSGKNSRAYELIGLGRRFIEIDANRLSNKDSYNGLIDEGDNIIIIDEVNNSNLPEIKKIKIKDGIIAHRKPYTSEVKEYKISELFILSVHDISESFRESAFTHIKL